MGKTKLIAMQIVETAIWSLAAINMAWLIIFGIRDHIKRFEVGEIETNLRTSERNIKGIFINLGLIIVFLILSRCWDFLPWAKP